VRLNTLHLTNFRQHAESRIEFDLGLTGVIGPNGAGKSTILEAIAWALYGQTAVRGTRDSIRNVRAPARAPVRVELDFELSGHRYRVVRGLTSAELYLDGGDEPIATTITDVGDLLQRRLGMTRAEFFHTYFTGQKELSVMAAMQPAERQLFLSRVLGYDRIRAAQGLARERRKLVSAEIVGVKSAMPDAPAIERMLRESRERREAALVQRTTAARRRAESEAALAVLAPQWEAAQRARDALQHLLSDLRIAENDVASGSRERDRVERDLAAIDEARKELDLVTRDLAPLNEILEEFQAMEALAREEGRRLALTEQLRALTDELNALRHRQATLAETADEEGPITTDLVAQRRALEEFAADLETRRTDWVRDRQEAETKRDALRRQYQELKTQRDRIVDLGEDGVCPTCSRVLGEHYRTVFEGLEEQLETIAVDGKYYSTRLEQLESGQAELRALDEQRKAQSQQVTELERRLARAQAAGQELASLARDRSGKEQRHDQVAAELRDIPAGFDAARHQELQARMERFAPLNERLARLGARIESESALRDEHARAVAQLNAARERAARLRAEYEESRFSEEDLQRQRQEYEEAVAAARAAEVALAGAAAEEERAAEAVTNAERAQLELERTRETLARLEREKRLHDELDRAYTDLRTDLNFQLRPELSELASSFLAELTDGRYGELELDDQYNAVVLEDGVPKPVISGGEEDLSNLVLRLSISQMIADRSGQAFSLLVLDEVFGSLDEVRRRNVVDLLRRLQDRFEQVILITHIEGVKDELDHVVLVDFDDQSGSSRVRNVEPSVPDLESLGAGLLGAGAES
jgi:exonuclease SbcC